MIKITNPKNGLFKIIDIFIYSKHEMRKIFKVYLKAGYKVEVYYVY